MRPYRVEFTERGPLGLDVETIPRKLGTCDSFRRGTPIAFLSTIRAVAARV
jgi:hypothetical protein